MIAQKENRKLLKLPMGDVYGHKKSVTFLFYSLR